MVLQLPQLFPHHQSHPDLAALRSAHLQWLLDSGQEERAGEVREKEGDLTGAIALYMKAGLPVKAAHLLTQHQVGQWFMAMRQLKENVSHPIFRRSAANQPYCSKWLALWRQPLCMKEQEISLREPTLIAKPWRLTKGVVLSDVQ